MKEGEPEIDGISFDRCRCLFTLRILKYVEFPTAFFSIMNYNLTLFAEVGEEVVKTS